MRTKYLSLFLLYFLPLSASIDQNWIEKVKDRIDSDAVERYTKELKTKLQKVKPDKEIESIVSNTPNLPKKQCHFPHADHDNPTSLMIAMTFDMPDAVWQQLSLPLEKTGGTFIVRGLPENRFSELVKKIQMLTQKGVNAPIHIDPKSFEKFSIHSAPTFIITENESFDKIAGNITLLYALEKMAEQGEWSSFFLHS